MSSLIPVFSPALALLLGRAEREAQRPLTRREVERIRDAGICVMMPSAEAAQMEASRGFRDVNPDDCWADWHRLRVEMTGHGCLPKLVFCAPGDGGFGARAAALLTERGIEHEVQGPDPRMSASFEASRCLADPSWTPADREAVARHASVVYVVGTNVNEREAAPASRALLAVAAELFGLGASALKCESSGIAHGRDRWLALASRARGHGPDARSALAQAFVQGPIADGDDLYTCGAHLLGLPDAIVCGEQLDEAEAAHLLRSFVEYLHAECAPGTFASGHTFRPDEASPRFRAAWEPCTGYADDDFFFNPFGRWRLVGAGR